MFIKKLKPRHSAYNSMTPAPHRLLKIFLFIFLCQVFTSLVWIFTMNRAEEQALMTQLQPRETSQLVYWEFWQNLSLRTFMQSTRILIEPETPCPYADVPVLVLVTSAPSHLYRRQAIRETYARHVPTYFFLGIDGRLEFQLLENTVESNEYSDTVVFDYVDSYVNLTLKTALMLSWSRSRCPDADFVLKTDDDVMINPWTLKEVVKEHRSDDLVGTIISGSSPYRDPDHKWYLPKWLYRDDKIPDYLSGPGYLINAIHLWNISHSALDVPLINIEDIYFTLLVANQSLGLNLVHDRRLSKLKPIFPFACAYWDYGSMHSLSPSEIYKVWSKIEPLGEEYEKGKPVCTFYKRYLSFFSNYTFT